MADRTSPFGTAGGDRPDRSGGTDSKAREMKDQAQEKAAHVAAEAKERGEHLVEEGMEKAREIGDRAGEIARSQTDEQRQRVAEGVRAFAQALRRGADELPEDRRQYERYIDGVADRVESVSRYIEERDVNSMTREARRFARDHTPLFLTGAFALGMVGARFIKSSGDEAREGRYTPDPYANDRQLPPGTERSATRYDRPEPYEETRIYGRPGRPGPEETGYA